MIGYFGDIIFETSDKKICNFNDFKQAASANYSEPRIMKDKLIKYCESGKVCPLVIGGHKIGGGKWTVDSIDANFKEVWNRGELVSVEIAVTATEYY